MVDLTGRVVLVTGGNGGIGLGMARACATAGADLVLWGRQADKNAAAVDELHRSFPDRRVAAYVCDVADEAQVTATFERSVAELGRVDTLVANAGVSGRGLPLTDISLEEWRRVTSVNLDGVFLCFREAARHMIERGDGGALVAIASVAAIHGPARNEAYAASKTGVLGLVRSVAVELARHRIRVNAVCPGWTVTDLARGGYEDDRFRTATTQRTPVRRWAEPDELGAVGVYLADPSNTFHTGDTLVVDGGYSIF